MPYTEGVDTALLSGFSARIFSPNVLPLGSLLSANPPASDDVRNDIPVGETVGNMVVPPPNTVRAGVHYDSNSSIVGTRT